jgi:hypothetical protein
MGHNGERSRGDSRLRDWPDVEWRIVRQDDDPASPRFITAYGRDVEVAESQLLYDAEARRLTVVTGSRRDVRARAAFDEVQTVLRASTVPLSRRAIERACAAAGSKFGRPTIGDAIKAGIRSGAIRTESGPKRATLHRLGDGDGERI